MSVSPAMEDYLETILLLERQGGAARVTDIANRMGVAKSSVHTALHNLSDKGLLIQEHYGTVHLTEEGARVASGIYSRHKALVSFFEHIVGVSGETAEKDACAVEHIISQDSMARIRELTQTHIEKEHGQLNENTSNKSSAR